MNITLGTIYYLIYILLSIYSWGLLDAHTDFYKYNGKFKNTLIKVNKLYLLYIMWYKTKRKVRRIIGV